MDVEDTEITKEEFDESLEVVMDYLFPDVEKMQLLTQKNELNCMAAIIRRHVKQVMEEPDEGYVDGRKKPWCVEMVFFHYGSDGQVDRIAESGVELVYGFEAVRDLIHEFLSNTHPNDEIDFENNAQISDCNLAKRLGGMRPAISKGGGTAQTSLRYVVDGEFHAIRIRISREGKELPPL